MESVVAPPRASDRAPVRADVAAAILAGGAAVRLGGRVKPLIELDGRTVLDRQLDVLRPRVQVVVLSANDPEPYAHTELPTVADDAEGQGPLAGLVAALRWCRRPYLLVVAGDMPFVSSAVVDRLLSRRAPGVDAVAARTSSGVEPLLAVYSTRCLAPAQARLASGERKTAGLLTDEDLTIRWLEEPELRELDPELRSLTNINTADDL